jgi:predicted permease
MTPFGSLAMSMPFLINGRARPNFSGAPGSGRESTLTADFLAVTPNYFQTMRIPMLQGRDFDAHDTADHPFVIIVNRTFAQQFFRNQDAIGQRLTLDFVPNEPTREIIGVVGDTVGGPLQRRPDPAFYVPHVQQTVHFVGAWVYSRVGMVYAVRTSGDPRALVPTIQRAVAEVDPLTPIAAVQTVSQTMNAQIGDLRLSMTLLSLFGAIAAILVATGLYGVLAYAVAARTREIGIRMALGARARDVLILIGRQAGWMLVVGLVLGLGAALGLTRVIQGQLFGITPNDPLTYVAVVLMLVLVAALAAVVPTRRATRVDPLVALRTE